MWTLMVVLVFPTPQFGGELPGRAEDRWPVKLLSIRAVAALDFAVDLGATRRDAPMRDAEIPEMPGEIGPELVAVVRLDSLDGHREPLAHLVEKGDRIRNRAVGIDPQDAVAGGLIHRRELIEAPAPELEVLDVHLDGLPGHGELAAAPRPGPVPLHRDPGAPRAA